jgi:AcrR family transcriptional regulator
VTPRLRRSPETRRRRTQAERSATTRARLLDATLETLADVGYAATTTSEIARRAGLTRGAQMHHFHTKEELVVAAVAHLFERRHADFLEAFAALPPGIDRMEAAIDLLWERVSGRAFHAVLELIVASRTDPKLHQSVAPLVRAFADTVDRTFFDLFAAERGGGALFELAPRFALALLEGLALGRIVSADDGFADRALTLLKALSRLVLQRRPDNAPPEDRS